MRRFSIGIVALAAMAGLAACAGGSTNSGISAAQVSQRYEAAIGPANSALGAFVSRAVAVSAGAPGGLSKAATKTASTLRKASGQVSAIAAPPPLQRDITDVARTLNTLVTDLTSLSSARGADVSAAVALVVADAGREAASDELVKLALVAATTPTTAQSASALSAATVPDVTTTVAPDTTTSTSRRTTTTRPGTTPR